MKLEAMEEYVTSVAKENGWLLNPDANLVKKIIRSLVNSQAKFGVPYCPCSIQRSPDKVCPCNSVWHDMAEIGHCNCRLYFARGEDVKEAEESV